MCRPTKGLRDLSFVDDAIGERAIEAFNKRHMEEYGHVREGEVPEITGVRLATFVETPSPDVARGSARQPSLRKSRKTRRANLGDGYKDDEHLPRVPVSSRVTKSSGPQSSKRRSRRSSCTRAGRRTSMMRATTSSMRAAQCH